MAHLRDIHSERELAERGTASLLKALLDAGATLKGRTHMDELAYSLNGENAHYGTPRNPACPDRIPGGSSSGSAVAVASGDVDFAIGSDTGGVSTYDFWITLQSPTNANRQLCNRLY